ncbi:LGFP repeat-containing protein [Microbacterium marinilacus]|nr:hypothetical protein [Microbacterium marinilacus]MBY0687188.1 hypothetical protein [Microbacterium marinilacus]
MRAPSRVPSGLPAHSAARRARPFAVWGAVLALTVSLIPTGAAVAADPTPAPTAASATPAPTATPTPTSTPSPAPKTTSAPKATPTAEPSTAPVESAEPDAVPDEDLPGPDTEYAAPPVETVERDDLSDVVATTPVVEEDAAGDVTMDVADPGNVPYPASGSSSGSGDGASGSRFELVAPAAIVPAAPVTGFSAGNIISNSVFTNKGTMTEKQIKSFIDGKVAKCQSGYTCLENYAEKTPTRKADSYCSKYTGGQRESAARIIHKVSQACGINPQVLLVMLQKEQGLVTHTWPSDWRFTIAMGMGCPDTADCDKNYYGFFNQVYGAARQMKIYGQSNYFTWYAPGATHQIRYHPKASCGSSAVKVQNQATANLYYYTPYQPNKAALAAGSGTGDSCSSYGNRNFYTYFRAWFGSTGGGSTSGGSSSGGTAKATAISKAYAALGSAKGKLGEPISAESCGLTGGGCYRHYENGSIHWTANTGARATWGSIGTHWRAVGGSKGTLRYPSSNEVCGLAGGGCYQTFQGGSIHWSSATGSHMTRGAIRNAWRDAGWERGALGYPTTDEACGLPGGGCYQTFQGGSIHWSPSTGAHVTRGAIRNAWRATGWERGKLGYPTSNEWCGLPSKGCYQDFQGGKVYWSSKTGSHAVWGAILTAWKARGYERGTLGYPTSDESCNAKGVCVQNFQRGRITWSSTTGAVVRRS